MGSYKGNRNAVGAGNPKSAKELAKMGEKTRFGSGNDAKAASAKGKIAKKEKGTIRGHLRTLIERQFCPPDDKTNPTLNDFAKAFGIPKTQMTYGHLAAIKFLQQGMANGKVMAAVIDNVDEKLKNTNVTAGATLAELLALSYKTDEEIDAEEGGDE